MSEKIKEHCWSSKNTGASVKDNYVRNNYLHDVERIVSQSSLFTFNGF